MDIDLTTKLKKKMSSYGRIRGRYNASELYFINNGLITPEQWLYPDPKNIKEVIKMWNGIGVHRQLEELLGKENSEHKRDVVFKGITLVGKADFLPPDKKDEVWEFKTSDKKIKESKEWYDHQAKLYCTMFDKSYGVVYQPVQNDEGVYLKTLAKVERDDKWFEGEIEKLYQFHLKVEELWKNPK